MHVPLTHIQFLSQLFRFTLDITDCVYQNTWQNGYLGAMVGDFYHRSGNGPTTGGDYKYYYFFKQNK